MREGLQKIVSDEDTIVAIATPLGLSGIGVIRVSGRRALSCARRYFKATSRHSEWHHRKAIVGLWLDTSGNELDQVIVTFFEGPGSYTGEDVIEISAHGNPFVLGRIVETMRHDGIRLAVPGEFTLRAVAHGKMDLVQAEAVREFVEAQTEAQAKTALRQMEGSLSKRIQPIKDKAVGVIAQMEAGIDFAEDDVSVPTNAMLVEHIRALRVPLESLKETFGYGRILGKGLRLAILGKPNVGKSSLFNRLISVDRAIVTSVPGTTRDVLTETISMEGIPLRVADTAGIHETVDEVESIGVSRTFETLSDADLALIVLDGSRELDEDDYRVLDRASQIPLFVVINKNDLPQKIKDSSVNGVAGISVSAKTGEGLEELRDAVRAFLFSRRPTTADDLILTNERQHEAISSAAEALSTAEEALCAGVPHEMVLLDLYRSLAALGELTGEVMTEDILGRIFSTFCIGK
jgi:tRNA modification GTPase